MDGTQIKTLGNYCHRFYDAGGCLGNVIGFDGMVANGCHKDEWWYIEQYELCRCDGNSIFSCIEYHCLCFLHGSVDFEESMISKRVTKLLLIKIEFITQQGNFFLLF